MHKSLSPGAAGIAGAQTFSEAAALAARSGFGALDYSVAALEEQGVGVSEARDIMGAHGVVISSFGLPVSCGTREAFDKTFPRLEKTCRAASRLGVGRCSTWLMSCSDEYGYAENFRRCKKMYGMCAEVLNEYGIALGLEFLGPKLIWTKGRHPFIHTLEGMLELCDAIGTGNAGLLLDAYHCYTSGLPGGAFEKLVRGEKDIVVVHLNDAPAGVPPDELPDSPRLCPGEPGSGGNDTKAFLRALKALGYTGPVVMEPFSKALAEMPDDGARAKAVRESMDSVWPA